MDANQQFDKNQYLKMELMRFTTAGSVDDGKSTLIGRLLYDSKAIFKDQMDTLEEVSKLRGEEGVNLALLTDGLRAEREQGITIDVAYRYFSTPKRKFIIADTPGHEQYTRNMVTGASTADLAIILIDARNGVLPQSRRHGIIASLLGIQHIIVAVNKMDAVDYDKSIYDSIVQEYTAFSEKLDIHDITFIPISALKGDNVVEKSQQMDWYKGPTVLYQLENVVISADQNLLDFRFPVQYVIRPDQDFRGFSGRISSGSIKVGEPVIVLPSMKKTRVKAIFSSDTKIEEAFIGDSIVLTLEDEIDISRGDMIVREHNVPEIADGINATICWMDEQDNLDISVPYIIQHTTRSIRGYVKELNYVIDVNTLHRKETQVLSLNEIGRVELKLADKLFIDPYKKNRYTGSFILINPNTNKTVAAGMIRNIYSASESVKIENAAKSTNVEWQDLEISQADREKRNGHQGHCIWLTGLSGSGKSTIAKALQRQYFSEGKQVYLLDGDNLRHGLCSDLGFSSDDRNENIRRAGHVASLLYKSGNIVICSFISPLQQMRSNVRDLFPAGSFSEVYVNADIESCKKRDPKGLYKKALRGEIQDFTGISSPYEVPDKPEIEVDTVNNDAEHCFKLIYDSIEL